MAGFTNFGAKISINGEIQLFWKPYFQDLSVDNGISFIKYGSCILRY